MPTADNPVLTGFHPDPSILRVNDEYYLATSTFQWFGGVQLYRSRDLINWQELPSPLTRASQLNMTGVPNSGGVWAPCLSYCDGTFYLIYTNVQNFHGVFKDAPNYLVTAQNICGPWSEPVFLNSSGFDPSLFHDGDGRKYLVNMVWDHRTENHAFAGIALQEYSETEKRLIGSPRIIYRGTQIGATEAPHLYKANGYYYLMVAEGGTMYHHGVRLARSKNLLGPYETDPEPLLTARDEPASPLQRAGHASLVQTQQGDYYIAFLCGRPLSGRCTLGRETAIAQVVWNEDGWLRLKEGGTLPPAQYSTSLPLVPVPPLPECDLFDCDELPPRYKTLRIPFEEVGSLSARKGYLRLYGQQAITSWIKQSMVARRLQHACAECTVKLEFAPQSFQQMAGLSAFYDTYNFFYLYLTRSEKGGNELRILVRDSLRFYNATDGGVHIGEVTSVFLRVRIQKLRLQFYYSLDGERYLPVGKKLDCSNLSDEAYALIGHEGHTGTFLAMACQDLTGAKLPADFKSFAYRPLDE